MAKKQKTKILILLATLFIIPALLLAGTSISHAQVQPQEVDTIYFTPQIEIPHSGISGKTEVSSVDDDGFVTSDLLARYIKAIYDYGIMVGGILAAIMIMAGGVIWLTSAGNSGAVEKAKSIMTGSVVGLVILFGSWFILNTINPDLVEMKGIAMIQVQNVLIFDMKCCHVETGPINFKVRQEGNKMIYLSGDKEGELFNSCAADYDALTCPSNGECKKLVIAGAPDKYYCYDSSDVCCNCITGPGTPGARAHCYDSDIVGKKISESECREMCKVEQVPSFYSAETHFCDRNNNRSTRGECKRR